MNNKFVSTGNVRLLEERINEIYKGKSCDLIVTYNGRLAKKNGNGLSYILDDPNDYLDRVEKEFQEKKDKKINKLKRKIVSKIPVVVVSGALALVAIGGLAVLKWEADYEEWRTIQILNDGGTTGVDKEGRVYGIPKDGKDNERYSKDSYREYLKSQKEKGK